MEKRWIKAATILPPTIKICGAKLLPFCLRHRIALEALNSPVIEPEAEITPTQFMLALRVLSSHDLTTIRRPWTLREQFYLAWFNHSKEKFVSELRKLIIYFEAQNLWPRIWAKDNQTSGVQIPWQLTVVSSLVRCGVQLEDAFCMPEAQAVWMYFANCKAEGAKVELMTEEEWEAIRKDMEERASASEQPNKLNRN